MKKKRTNCVTDKFPTKPCYWDKEGNCTVHKQMEDLRLKADAQGNVPLVLIHDAKISTTRGINFFTPKEKNTTGKYIIIRYPNSSDDCSIERFNTFEELEIAVKDNYTSSNVIACKEIAQKLVLED